jgi:hypothetical protein
MLTLLLDLVCHRFCLPPERTPSDVRETEVPNVGWKKTFKGEERLVRPCTVGGAGDFVLGVSVVCVTDLSLLHVCLVAQ